MFGFQGRTHPSGCPWIHSLRTPSSSHRPFPVFLERGRADDIEILMRRVDGSDFWGSLTIRLHRTDDAVVMQGVITDISHRRESLERLHKTVMGTVSAMGRLVDMKDPYTAGHQERVAHLATAIATEAGLSPERIEGVNIAGKLHDMRQDVRSRRDPHKAGGCVSRRDAPSENPSGKRLQHPAQH
ncbi:MAG: hypothetical protein MZV70_33470 [Desulfobacterales bacterium]|nr:hypothetical protein [Desulfobacterales bacterium]